MVKMRLMETANLFTSNPTDLIFSEGKKSLICVKEFAKYSFCSPKFLTSFGTFLNANICQNGNFTLAGFPSENSRSLSYLFGLTSQKGETTK